MQHLATIREMIATICDKIDYPGLIILPYGDYGFSLLLPGAERREAIEMCNELSHNLRHLGREPDALSAAAKMGIGLATVSRPPRNFPPRDLFDGANRCLYASHASGGGVVKSIEIY